MQLTRLQSSDDAEWRRALERFAPSDDIYFQPGYAKTCESNGDGEAECLIVHEGESALLLPVLRCSIPNQPGLSDVQGPYGYGGPLVANENSEFLKRAWQLISGHWEQSGVVAAFLRCHPLLENAHHFGPDWDVAYDRQTVSVDLKDGLERAFDGPGARKHRRDTAQARRAGAEARFATPDSNGLSRFRELYLETMSRLGAGDEYFFSTAYFEALAQNFGDAVSLVEVSAPSNPDPLAMALVFWGPRWAHYHLSARQAEGGNASHLLLQAVAEQTAQRGLAGLHMGGGRTPSSDDSLFRFKRWVGNAEHRFHTARLVVNRGAYNDLVAAWREQHSDERPLWFLSYRQKRPVVSPSFLKTS